MQQDNDLLICELQHEIEGLKAEINGLVMEVKYGDKHIKELLKENNRLHELLALAKDPTHNPSFVAKELMELTNES
jgi:FtsZ-binding cell division protein ZapB